MAICFVEINKDEIIRTYPSYFHEKARYFKATKNGKTLCFYGIISRTAHKGEAFLMMDTFQGSVLSKGFFISLFNHVSGYREVWTWTKWDRLAKLFHHFKKFGIEKTGCPFWDNDPTKTWFIKRMD